MPPSKLHQVIGADGKKCSPKLQDDLKNFIIDIDGVICEDVPNEEPERMATAEEIPGAKDQINEWYDQGNIITFLTARLEEHREATEKWLKEHGFKYHGVLFGKPRGGNYHYIDDRKIRATNFPGKFGKMVYRQKEIQVFE